MAETAEAADATERAKPQQKLRYRDTQLPLRYTWRAGVYASGVLLVVAALYMDPLKFAEQALGYAVLYPLLGGVMELNYRRVNQCSEAESAARNRQIWEELKMTLDGFAIQIAFSVCWITLIDPFGPHAGHFDRHDYTSRDFLLHVAFFFVWIDTCSFFIHYYLLHGVPSVWSAVHLQHHQIRNPTAFGGTAVHPLEGIVQLTLPANVMAWLIPVKYEVQQALMMLIFVFPGECSARIFTQISCSRSSVSLHVDTLTVSSIGRSRWRSA